ncbi:hypothetical protein R3P38DRAFT_3249775 [Favolaschia claudopus]|uniref:Uncharacterized protein n=1 Tax=Favolaschia claudopus TaxID=2862362 RepID=A0AAW0EJ03_9AGAR
MAKAFRKRARTSTTQNPRNKRIRRDNDDPQNEDQENDPPQDGSDDPPPELREGMTQAELYKAARLLQAKVNEADRARQEEGRDALANVTNQPGPTEEDIEAANDERYIQARGKQFVATMLLWMPYNDIDAVFEAKEDPEYNPLERFGSRKQFRVQGALRDVHDFIPEQYRGDEEWSGWVQQTFHSAMKSQLSGTANRLRGLPDIFDCTTMQLSSSESREEFGSLIGLKKNKKGEPYYDTVDVPILYAEYDADSPELDLDRFLLAEGLFLIHAAITKGPKAARLMKSKKPAQKCQSVEDLWGLRKTTPGMIAGAAVWLRWVLSPDECFTPVGDVTGIKWLEDFEFYLEYLISGLRDKKDCVVNLFREWDKKFYPNSEESTARAGDNVTEEAAGMRNTLMEALDARPTAGGDDDSGDDDSQ